MVKAVERHEIQWVKPRGTDLKDEVVMLGAHFDTWHASPNASDNTSGVAVMLEAMRFLKSNKYKTEKNYSYRTLVWRGTRTSRF
ncbi:MAG: hypothetical protein CM1200mP1_17100 [Candidatus Neomarinimicrobiota bacterium]|nr:MAG: hypothetical protein CM1200mP1_17100 [Candidatus Neomarinimicrobiota bacterium]